MRVYFCPDCGAYSTNDSSTCEECQAEIGDESWADITSEELHQLDYVEDLDLPPGLPSWEYDVIRLKPESSNSSMTYTSEILNRMGEKGWELVSVVPIDEEAGARYGVFKRSWDAEFER